jgi:hypothetical protein
MPRSGPAIAASLGPGASTVAALSLLLAMPAEAARFEALCGKQRCRIEITERGFQGPAGFIPADRIVQWNAVGWDNHNALVSSLGATGGALTGTVLGALASCWTLIACPIGILGGAVMGGVAGSRAGRSADYQFSVAGFDAEGNKLTENFRFINPRPVQGMVAKLTRVSGLEMGVRREVAIAAPEPVRPAPRLRSPAPRGPAGVAVPGTPSSVPRQAPDPDPASSPLAVPPAASDNPLSPGPEVPVAQEPRSESLDRESLETEMPLLLDAIDPYQGTPLLP